MDLIIYRDIIERYGIRNRYALEIFIKNTISSYTKEFSVHKLYNTLKSQGYKVSKKSLYNFQKILEDIQFVFFLRKYSKSLKTLELSTPRVHLIDLGIYNYLVSENIGKIMENVVFLELLKSGFVPNKELFYYSNQKGEIDLIVEKDSRVKYLIQVTYANDFDEIEARERRNLLRIGELFKRDKPKLIVITWDYEDERKLSWFGKENII